MKNSRVLTAVALMAAVLPIAASPAMAAAPSNDVFAGATPVGLGFSEVLDTTEATHDADDDEINATCPFPPGPAPATDASVWYSFTAGSDGLVAVDMSGSSYPAGAAVATGSPGTFAGVACGGGVVQFHATAGATYAVLVFDFLFGAGGELVISFDEPPPPTTLELTVDDQGSFEARSGSARITGQYSCTGGVGSVDIFGLATQSVGRFEVSGFASASIAGPVCDGTDQPWSALVLPSSGEFRGGKLDLDLNGFACGASGCAHASARQRVQLQGGGW